MPTPRETPPDVVPEGVGHYLLVGCWAGGAPPALDVYRLAGAVLQGRGHDALLELWRACGAAVRRAHRGPTFAEAVLAGHAPHRGGLCLEHGIGIRPPAEPADAPDDDDDAEER